MKILFVHNEYQQKGGEDLALQLEMDALKQYGHTVSSIVYSNAWDSTVHTKWQVALEAIYSKKSEKALIEKIDKTKPDIVHAHNLFFRASPSVLYACEKRKVPVVMTLHNYRLVCANALLLRNNSICEKCIHQVFPLAGIYHKCYRESYLESLVASCFSGVHKIAGTWENKVKRYIVLTDFAKEKILGSSLNLSAKQLVVKPNYVADPGIGRYPRENYYLFVGRLSKEKGIETLLNVISKTKKELIVAGQGPEKDRLQLAFKSFANIKFVGHQTGTTITSLMKNAKALIFPSHWYEGMPYSILESFATGTPVIASKLGAMEVLIENGVNGLHFEAGNGSSLLQKIEEFERLGDFGFYQRARQTFEEKYSIEKHYSAIVQIYEETIKEYHAQSV